MPLAAGEALLSVSWGTSSWLVPLSHLEPVEAAALPNAYPVKGGGDVDTPQDGLALTRALRDAPTARLAASLLTSQGDEAPREAGSGSGTDADLTARWFTVDVLRHTLLQPGAL